MTKQQFERYQQQKEERVMVNAQWVADYLGVNKNSVYLLARRGEIPVVNVGRNYLFNRISIEEWSRGEFRKEEA
ncbi:helix-turn-helix domain-containing protein [Bhargavaea beijingensis]|uniref:DNA-binding protein n=1 Tax=Bhargavaea beijingensis TaxID=426756 RepID=A0ABX9ZC99_9BACL|nr:helix-turn-helix domain-containing protein [Bhargavaea beijingensis]RSK30981.1 DNA-binding protein [Bhargavaea beijingensis]